MKLKPNLRSFQEADRKVEELISKVERQGKREAIAKATRPLKKAAKAKVHKRSGFLAKSIGHKVTTFKKDQIVIATIGPRTKTQGIFEGQKVWPARYAHLEEFGSSRKDPHPFMRPAFDEQKGAAQRIYETELGKSIERVGRRLGAKKFKV